MVSLFSFLIVIGICVVSHEMGHYLMARWRGVQVHEFSFGMGPALWSRRKGETLWAVRALPIGGFVRFRFETTRPEFHKSSSVMFVLHLTTDHGINSMRIRMLWGFRALKHPYSN